MTLAFAMLLMLPARLLWRRLTRPIERLGWSLRLSAEEGAASDWRLGVLPKDRASPRKDGRGDPGMETAVLVLDKVGQGLAVQRRGLIWPVRF